VGIIDTDFYGWMSFLSLSLAVIEHAWVLLSAQTRDVGNHSVCLINAQYSLCSGFSMLVLALCLNASEALVAVTVLWTCSDV